ncbi:MAG: NAD(P)/FAD-dependent oxidoreductase [Hespellia sp.]|nr:NAD(P)/FAD-dependent oxidoreductase [Hespellia sp.]
MKTVGIIGAGASGMMAAISARNHGAEVMLFEHNDRVGKKILSTGNGRCNFTNIDQKPEYYRSDNPGFANAVLSQFSVSDTISFFLKLGVYSKNKNGYLYPNSEQASSVLDVLRFELERLQISIYTNTVITSVCKTKKGFQLQTPQKTFSCDSLILAAGSKAAPVTGSDGSGYDIAKSFGHHFVPVLPALVQLKCSEKFYKNLAGVRTHGTVSLYADDTFLAADTGELQLTKYGISGIPVFQISRFASRALYEKKTVTAEIDFMPDFNDHAFTAFLDARIQSRPDKTLSTFFIGLFPSKVADTWISLSRIDRNKKVGELSDDEFDRLIRLIKHFRTDVTDTNGFASAQICCGGIATEEINSKTMESALVEQLYFSGEIIDVDGICGGYNLQWAWSSGYVAGKEAAVC